MRIEEEMSVLKQETQQIMAKQKEDSRVKIEAHLKDISEKEYELYKQQHESNTKMHEDSEALRKKIKVDQKEMKRKSEAFNT